MLTFQRVILSLALRVLICVIHQRFSFDCEFSLQFAMLRFTFSLTILFSCMFSHCPVLIPFRKVVLASFVHLDLFSPSRPISKLLFSVRALCLPSQSCPRVPVCCVVFRRPTPFLH